MFIRNANSSPSDMDLYVRARPMEQMDIAFWLK